MNYSYDDVILLYKIINNVIPDDTKKKIDDIKKTLFIENNIKKTIINKTKNNYAITCKLLNKIK